MSNILLDYAQHFSEYKGFRVKSCVFTRINIFRFIPKSGSFKKKMLTSNPRIIIYRFLPDTIGLPGLFSSRLHVKKVHIHQPTLFNIYLQLIFYSVQSVPPLISGVSKTQQIPPIKREIQHANPRINNILF